MACPKLVSKYSTPEIKWYQTDLTVVLRVGLIDVPDYYLRVEVDHLIFSTTTNDKEYCLILYFFGPVVAEKTVHKNVGREIRIYLTKGLKWYSWLRLTMSKEKNPLISYDQDHIYTIYPRKRYEVSVDRVQESKGNDNQVLYILPFDPSSDEESEDETFWFD